LKQVLKGIIEWKPFIDMDGVLTDREIGETIHTMEKTDEAFRLIVLRWCNPQMDLFNQSEYFYHVIATNSEARAEEVVWEYHKRGEMENIIKELKIGFSMAEMPSSDFGANALGMAKVIVGFSLGVLAYNTFVMMKSLLLKEDFKRKTISTIKWQLIEIAGKVIKKARQLILKVSTSIERFKEYLLIKERIEGLPCLIKRVVYNTS